MRGVCSLYVWYCTVVDIYHIPNIVTIMIIWYYAITWAYATMSVNDVNALFPRMFVVYLSVIMRETYTLYQWYGKVVGMHRITNVVTVMIIWCNAITWVYEVLSVKDTNELFPHMYVVYLSAMMPGAYTFYMWYCTVVDIYRNTNIVTIMTIWYNAITWVYAVLSVNDVNALFPRLYMVYLSVMVRRACTLYEWYCKLVGM